MAPASMAAAVLLVEDSGGAAVAGIFDVDEERLPLLPEGHVVRPALDGLEDPRLPPRLAVQLHGQGLAVQGGGQVDDVGPRGAGLHQRAVKPAPRVLALQGRLDVAVVLQVVADDERGAMGAVAAAADSLPGAEGLDGHAVAEHDARRPATPVPARPPADSRRPAGGCRAIRP